MVIAGLPFTINSQDIRPAFAVGDTQNLALPVAQDSLAIFAPGNGTILKVRIMEATTGGNGLILSEFSADGLITFSGSYQVA